jgi:hypothetical protein
LAAAASVNDSGKREGVSVGDNVGMIVNGGMIVGRLVGRMTGGKVGRAIKVSIFGFDALLKLQLEKRTAKHEQITRNHHLKDITFLSLQHSLQEI